MCCVSRQIRLIELKLLRLNFALGCFTPVLPEDARCINTVGFDGELVLTILWCVLSTPLLNEICLAWLALVLDRQHAERFTCAAQELLVCDTLESGSVHHRGLSSGPNK